VHTTVLDILKDAASYALAEYKRSHEDSPEAKLDIINLEGHFNVFEIMGPKSSQVIHGCLSPDRSEDRAEFSQVGPHLLWSEHVK
jgi:ribonuclease P/MRP protein subunit POP1